MYAIVDWHMLDPGDPNYNLARAKTFFTEIAQRHNGQDQHPLRDRQRAERRRAGPTIKSYAEQIIPVIRAAATRTPSILRRHPRLVVARRLRRRATRPRSSTTRSTPTNIMYTFHFYAASHGSEYLNALSRAADQIPMFVTEFGTQDAHPATAPTTSPGRSSTST